jgi:signal transduction histidine kinase/ligand-binding sensor domain-containing protein
MRKNFLTLSVIMLFVQLHAQTNNPLRFEQIEGLSQNSGYSIIKDKQDFLWIATANGLNRYDGIEMKVYKPELEKKDGQMLGRVIRSGLLEDGHDRIWFSTDLAVQCFEKKKERFITYYLSGKPGYRSKNKAATACGKFANPLLMEGDHLWLANAGDGIFDLNIKTKECIHYPLSIKDSSGNVIQLMYHGVNDGKGRIWFASRKGLITFNRNTRQWKQYFGEKSFYSLSYCQDTLYASEGKNVIWLDPENFHFGYTMFENTEDDEKRDLIHRVSADLNNNIWTGDETGNIYCKPFRDACFRWKGNINGYGKLKTNYPVYSLYCDTSGKLWVGGYVLGLLKADINQQGFKSYPRHTDCEENEPLFINSIYEDKNDKVWMGTYQNGILVLDKKTGTAMPVQLPYAGPRLTYGNSVPLIQPDSKGNVWTSMSGYLFVKERNASHFTPIKIPPPANALLVPQLWSIAEYKDGWLFGTTVGLYILTKQNNHYRAKHLSCFGQKRVVNIWTPGNNKIWIAFESGGLTIAEGLDHLDESKTLFAETNVKSFLHDKKRQLLWIATSGGLIAYHLSTGRYKNFTEEDGLLNSYTYGILLDRKELWVSTHYGLSRGEIRNENNSVLPDILFTNYTSSDGLPDNQFNTWAFHKGKSGCFYFGTVKGVTWFSPNEIIHKPHLPKLRITKILVNEQRADSNLAPEYISKLSLPYYKNNLFFRFRGIDYENAKDVKYVYKMDGWDKDWVFSETSNEVRYNNLPDGHYKFNVKACNDSGIWNEDIQTVSIIIYPPFWKTWWFHALIALIVFAFIILVTKRIAQRKLRKQIAGLEKQRELDKDRQRISREMHDDIGAGLTRIALMSQAATQYKKTGIDNAAELEAIFTTSRQLMSSMSEIIWSLHPDNKNLDQLTAYIREELSKLLEYSGMDYSIILPENGKKVPLTSNQRRNLLLVTKEIVHNAVKYSNASYISIQSCIENKKLTFEIKDNGIGFDTSKPAKGNGLGNIKLRITELGGDLSVDSEPGKGCRFWYSILLTENQYY